MNVPIEEAFAFTEFLGLHYQYLPLHRVWAYKYSNPRVKDNWRNTQTLYEIWKLTKQHKENEDKTSQRN